MNKRPQVTAAADLAGGYIKALKARRQEVGVWELRGKIFARVLVAARDARLSGAEWNVLATLALHLEHLGRSKGMMTVASLADDCMVTERTVRNALRVLVAAKFISVRYRFSGQMWVLLDRRFNAKAAVPADKSANGERRRCAPRKKISTTGNSTSLELPVKDECTDSAPRRESNGEGLRPGTAHIITTNDERPRRSIPDHFIFIRRFVRDGTTHYVFGPAPPRKRAAPASSG